MSESKGAVKRKIDDGADDDSPIADGSPRVVHNADGSHSNSKLDGKSTSSASSKKPAADSDEDSDGESGEDDTAASNKSASPNPDSHDGQKTGSDDPLPQKERRVLKFRSYAPKDDELREKAQIQPKHSVEGDVQWMDREVRTLLKQTPSAAPGPPGTVIPLQAVVARKANWDLKRDVAPKLAALKQQTQTAIMELVKARVEQQKQSTGGDGSSSSSSDTENESDGEKETRSRAGAGAADSDDESSSSAATKSSDKKKTADAEVRSSTGSKSSPASALPRSANRRSRAPT